MREANASLEPEEVSTRDFLSFLFEDEIESLECSLGDPAINQSGGDDVARR